VRPVGFPGTRTSLEVDRSGIWDERSSRGDDGIAMLNAFQGRLVEFGTRGRSRGVDRLLGSWPSRHVRWRCGGGSCSPAALAAPLAELLAKARQCAPNQDATASGSGMSHAARFPPQSPGHCTREHSYPRLRHVIPALACRNQPQLVPTKRCRADRKPVASERFRMRSWAGCAKDVVRFDTSAAGVRNTRPGGPMRMKNAFR
jgi:hypothetical protein